MNCLWDTVEQFVLEQRSGGALADWVTTSVAMWPGVGFDVSGAKKQKGGGGRRWASLW